MLFTTSNFWLRSEHTFQINEIKRNDSKFGKFLLYCMYKWQKALSVSSKGYHWCKFEKYFVFASLKIPQKEYISRLLQPVKKLTTTCQQIWCDFDRASSLICGNKMPTRCNRGFYCISYCLLNMFRPSLCPSSGAQEYYTVVAACGISCCGFSSSWSGVELRVMCPVCRMLQHPANRTHNPLYNTLELLMMGIVMPKTCWASNNICNKNLCCI